MFDGADKRPWSDERIRKMLDWIDGIYEKGFRERAQAHVAEAKRLGCGFTVTWASQGLGGARIVADPAVPRGRAHVYQFDAPAPTDDTGGRS